MSRTDAHRPYWVKALDPLVPHQDHHNHTKGVCDLDTSYEHMKAWRSTKNRWRLNTCTRELDWTFATCSCSMCHARRDVGRERAHWRQERQKMMKDREHDYRPIREGRL